MRIKTAYASHAQRLKFIVLLRDPVQRAFSVHDSERQVCVVPSIMQHAQQPIML